MTSDANSDLLAEISTRLRVLRRSTVARHARIGQLAEHTELVALELERAASARHERELQDVAKDRHRDLHAVKANATEVRSTALTLLSRSVAELAPGPLSAPWTDDRWVRGFTPEKPPASWLRIGTVDAELLSDPVDAYEQPPLLVPLLDHPGWSLLGPVSETMPLLRGALLRLAAAVPLHRLEVTVYDPTLALDVGSFSLLRRVAPRSFATPIALPRDFESALDELVLHTGSNADILGAMGAESLGSSWAARGTLELTYRILVITGFPTGLSDTAQSRLTQLAQAGPARGVSVVVVPADDQFSAPEHSRLRDLLTLISVRDGAVAATTSEGLPARADGEPSHDIFHAALQRLTKAVERYELPSFPFATIVESMQDRWVDPGDEGLRAVIGRVGDEPLTIELRSSNPPMPNALVGGAVGQGKSNLLLVIIHALAAQYAPDDLEMYLLDFKNGLEFARLGPSGAKDPYLPHVVALGLESDRPFGLATLEHLIRECERRAELFKSAGATDIAEYRRRAGTSLPRLLLCIDEFHVLLDGDDRVADRAVEQLEQLARQGRAFGVHLLLASQTLGGVRGLAVKGDAIFSQFHNRISLKNTLAESRAILSQENTAAGGLSLRGEVVVNDDLGRPEANRRGMVAYADEQYLKRLREELWRAAPRSSAPVVFRGGEFAEVEDDLARLAVVHGNAETLSVLVGRTVGVQPEPRSVVLGRDSDQAVLLLGAAEREAHAVLASSLRSLTRAGRSVDVVVLDGQTSASDHEPGWLEAARPDLEQSGCGILHVRREALASYLLRGLPEITRTTVRGSREVVVLAVGLQRMTRLTEADPDTFTEPVDSLRELVRDGAQAGVHFLGWWHNHRVAQTHLGYGIPGVGTYVFAGASREDIRSIVGSGAEGPTGTPRVLVYRPHGRLELETLVPYRVPRPADIVGLEP